MIRFQPIDYLILAVYFVYVLGFGYWCTDCVLLNIVFW